MYAIESEKIFSDSYSIRESSNDKYHVDTEDLFRITPCETTEQLADQITTLAGQINAATYRFLKLIAEFDRR
jgi:hypothetical protein